MCKKKKNKTEKVRKTCFVININNNNEKSSKIKSKQGTDLCCCMLCIYSKKHLKLYSSPRSQLSSSPALELLLKIYPTVTKIVRDRSNRRPSLHFLTLKTILYTLFLSVLPLILWASRLTRQYLPWVRESLYIAPQKGVKFGELFLTPDISGNDNRIQGAESASFPGKSMAKLCFSAKAARNSYHLVWRGFFINFKWIFIKYGDCVN